MIQAITAAIAGFQAWVDVQFRTIESEVGEVRQLLGSRLKENYTVEEFAELVGRSTYTVRRWATEGKIRPIRLAQGGPKGRLLIPRVELNRVVASGAGGAVPAAVLD